VETNETAKKSFIASLTVPIFASTISNTVLTLLLADIAITFFGNATPASVGIAGQLSTVNSIGEAAISLLMGFLVVRFRHKGLYLLGVFLVIASAVGNFLAPNLAWMQVFYFLEGMGSMMVAIIATTIVGDLLPANKKGKVISYIVAAVFMSSFAGPLLINYIADTQGWRYNFLFFIFPAILIGLIISLYGIPFKTKNEKSAKNLTFRNFKQVFAKRSAVSCLICQFFFIGTSISLFTLPFFRAQFSLPRTATVYILMATSGIYVLSSLVTGRLVNKLRAKNLVILGTLMDGVFIIGLFAAPSLWISLGLNFVHVWFAGIALASFSCLVLDQVPDSRGTMISLNKVFGKAGDALTPVVGGLMLATFSSYSSLGLALGLMSIIGAAIVLFFVRNSDEV
jgi:predicted MFS family arabinose efflux permease